MHGCGNIIGCMIVSASLLNQGMDATVMRIGEGINAHVTNIGDGISIKVTSIGNGINADVTSIGNDMNAIVTRIGSGLNASASLVCSIGDIADRYVPFLVKEGDFILVDGKQFKVLRY